MIKFELAVGATAEATEGLRETQRRARRGERDSSRETPALLPYCRRAHRGWREFSGLPPLFWRLTVAMTFRGLGTFVLPFEAYYLAAARHLTAANVAIVMAAFGAGWAVGDPLGGYLADKLGGRSLIIWSGAASVPAFAALAYARSIPALMAASCAVGVTFDAWRPASQALLAQASDTEEQRKKCMTLFYWAINVSAAVSCVGGGLLAVTVGWDWLFLGNAAAMAAFGVATWILVPAQRRQSSSRQRESTKRPTLRRVPRVDWLFVVFTAVTLVWLTVYSQTLYGLPVRIAGDGIAPVGFGFIAAVNPATVGVVQLALQRWLVRLPIALTCACGVVLTGAGVAIIGLGSGLSWYLSASAIVVVGEILFYGPAQALVAELAPPGRQGSYLGIWGSTIGLSTLTAAAAGGAIVSIGGLTLLWEACAVAGAVAACMCVPVALRAARRGHGEAAASQVAQLVPANEAVGPGRRSIPATEEGGAAQ
jgi:MFS family permease